MILNVKVYSIGTNQANVICVVGRVMDEQPRELQRSSSTHAQSVGLVQEFGNKKDQ